MNLYAHSQGTMRVLARGAGIAGAALAAILLLAAAPAGAQNGTGGISADGTAGTTNDTNDANDSPTISNNVAPRVRRQVRRANSRTAPGRRARLRNGLAIAPRRAPVRIKRVIWAANEIAKGKGYCWGGGHGNQSSRCYDCSGAASYALRGGNFVGGSMPSTGYFGWRKRGRGDWLTVYTNSGHMYIVVAGLRFDTGMSPGRGPSWTNQTRSARGFQARHHPRF